MPGKRKPGSKQKQLYLDEEHQRMLEELAARGNRPHTQLLLAGLRKLYESEQPGLRSEVEALRAEVAELRKRLTPPAERPAAPPEEDAR